MKLHRFNGDEIFDVESAMITYEKCENNVYATTFRADAAKVPIQTLPDTVSLRAKPFAEVTLRLEKPPSLMLFAGQSFTLPEGYDKSTGDYRTNFYYCEHETLEENEIVILGRNGTKVRARITGMVIDVNYYDDSKPRMKVVVEAEFTINLSFT